MPPRTLKLIFIGAAVAIIGYLLINEMPHRGRDYVMEGEICWSARSCLPYRWLLIVAAIAWLWAAYLWLSDKRAD